MSPKVSIILPNYNYARFLDERISSLLSQTFEDFELIIVDDASTDNSREVIEKYRSDPRVRPIWFDANSGLIYQRWNDGASLATGDYIMFAGADDSCATALLDTLVRRLDAHANAGVAYSRSWKINAASARVSMKPPGDGWSSDLIRNGPEEALILLDMGGIPSASAALLRREIFEQCGRWDTSFEFYADHMLWARVMRVSDLVYVAEPLNYIRRHGNNAGMTSRWDKIHLERYRVAEYILRAFTVPEVARERACNQLARNWINQLLTDRWHADIEICRRTYGLARAVDSSVHRRIARLTRDRIQSAVARRIWK